MPWTNQYHFSNSLKSVLQISSKTKGFTDYYISAGEAENVTKNEIQRYNRKKWTSFNQFKDLQFGIWKVTLPDIQSDGKMDFAIVQTFLKNIFAHM